MPARPLLLTFALVAALDAREEFLGVIVLTTPQYTARRASVRRHWLEDSNRQQGVVARFFLTREEWTVDVAKESALNGRDMVMLDALRSTGYQALSRKVYASLAWFVSNRPARFLFKTDDDVWVHTPRLLVDLQALCLGRTLIDSYEAVQTRLDLPPRSCRESARFLYAGTVVPNRKVVTVPGEKYSNMPLYTSTGLTQYPYYFGGTGYVVSGLLARAITRPPGDDQPPLQFWPREDATMSFWLLAYNITRLPLSRVEINSARDVFTKVNRSARSAAGQRATFRTKFDVCDHPVWAVHRLFPWQMRLMNRRLSQCAQSAEVKRSLREALAARSGQTSPPRGGMGALPSAVTAVDLAAARPNDSPAQQAPSGSPRKVFLDIGSRDGHAIEALAREHPHDFPQYEVHAFEADPRHAAEMDRFLQRHAAWSNVRVHQPIAAWVEDGTRPAPAEGRVAGRAGEVRADPLPPKDTGSQVQAIDLAAWIRRQIGTGSAGADGRSGLELRGRLDVGGDEFSLLPHLLRTGVLGLFTELDVAWHDGRREDMWLWPAQYEDVLKALDIRHSKAHQTQAASRRWVKWASNAVARRAGGGLPGRVGAGAEGRASKKGIGDYAG